MDRVQVLKEGNAIIAVVVVLPCIPATATRFYLPLIFRESLRACKRECLPVWRRPLQYCHREWQSIGPSNPALECRADGGRRKSSRQPLEDPLRTV